jgi:hypothetical protein
MHRSGIEPELLAWKAKVMPLDHRCRCFTRYDPSLIILICPITVDVRDSEIILM